MQTESIRASQLAELGMLAASVAHEINNPIYGVISCAQLLLGKSSDKDVNNDDIVNRIIKESNRIANVVKSLLSFARDTEVDKGNHNIHELISDILTLTASQIRKDGINIKMLIPS